MSRRAIRRSAFTLIELLVVVAIISLLVSILLPALSKAKAQGRKVVCMNNLRTQGEVAHFYAEDNAGWIVRGLDDGRREGEGGNYSMMQIRYLKPKGVLEDGTVWDGVVNGLWRPTQQTELIKIIRQIPQFQCPDHPFPRQPFDYVSSAMPFPYPKSSISADGDGGQGDADSWYQPEPVASDGYISYSKTDDMLRAKLQPSQVIYVTELNKSVSGKREDPMGIRFTSFFYASQLPFGAYPRIANDQRHPGGLSVLFFDGHSDIMPLNKMDEGYGKSLGRRLKWFTAVPQKYW